VIQIVTADAVMTKMHISAINHWRKREITEKLIEPSDRVTWITDSWGSFSTTTDTALKATMFDGTIINAKAILPTKVTEYIVTNGGDADNVLLATRGGMTTEWARYWIDYIVKETNPNKIIFHFGINDYNSFNVSSIDTNYDFDTIDIWGSTFAS